jgi:hypothetical protein
MLCGGKTPATIVIRRLCVDSARVTVIESLALRPPDVTVAPSFGEVISIVGGLGFPHG